MTVREFYAASGGSYEEATKVLLTESRICKYLFKFADSDDYREMNRAIDTGNWEEAFRFSHNLKGICLNLALLELSRAASELCEEFRNGAPQKDIGELRRTVAERYDTVIGNIGLLRESME